VMDILTEKGKISVEDEKRAVEIFHSNYPEFEYIGTPKDKPAIIDGVLVKDNSIYAVVETKCRYNFDLETFFTRFDGKWLVTYEKMEKSRKISQYLGVSLVGFLYVKQSDLLLVSTISDQNGLYQSKVIIEATETQKTINGGKIVRNNAYIDMALAAVLSSGGNNAP